MNLRDNPVRAAHRWMVRHSFYPLALSSLLACSLWAGRVWKSQSWGGMGLIWNLFLAWLPYLCSLGVLVLHEQHPRRWWRLVIPGAVWLLFLPNAPYIITDLWHLRARPPIPLWYDLGFYVTFAWTGCFLGLTSLRMIQGVIKSYLGRSAGWVFVMGSLCLTGIGIYLGRFLGWNSWDLILNPRPVLVDIAALVLHPYRNLHMLLFASLFAAILFVCYLTFASVQQLEHS
jgi:uncharacterized membrane protein